MKKGYVYLIIDRDDQGRQYHFFDWHDLVVCTGETTEDGHQTAFRFEGDNGSGKSMMQWLLPHHVAEIGKL